MTKREFNKKKKEYAKIATELCYGEEVVRRIRLAATENEITNILIDARKGMIGFGR